MPLNDGKMERFRAMSITVKQRFISYGLREFSLAKFAFIPLSVCIDYYIMIIRNDFHETFNTPGSKLFLGELLSVYLRLAAKAKSHYFDVTQCI